MKYNFVHQWTGWTLNLFCSWLYFIVFTKYKCLGKKLECGENLLEQIVNFEYFIPVFRKIVVNSACVCVYMHILFFCWISTTLWGNQTFSYSFIDSPLTAPNSEAEVFFPSSSINYVSYTLY